MWLQARETPREQWPAHVEVDTPGRLFFNRSQIGSHHLWYDKHVGEELPLVSDIMAESLKISGITGVSFSERRTV
jgi:hypothetical protein